MDMVHPTNTVRKSAYNYFLGGSIVEVEEEEDQWQQVEADSASCRRALGLSHGDKSAWPEQVEALNGLPLRTWAQAHYVGISALWSLQEGWHLLVPWTSQRPP